jgi:cell division septum initiation protein DivIVA
LSEEKLAELTQIKQENTQLNSQINTLQTQLKLKENSDEIITNLQQKINSLQEELQKHEGTESIPITSEQEHKLRTYDSILEERDKYKKERDRLVKDRQLTKDASNIIRLADEIQKKIDLAYRANPIERGYHIKLMNNILA